MSLKDMATGEQTLTDADQAAARILAGLAAARKAAPIREPKEVGKKSVHGKKICNKTASHALVR